MAVHAAVLYAVAHPSETAQWETSSTSLVVLAVSDETRLVEMIEQLGERGVAVSTFVEPDLGNELVSAACLLDEQGCRLLAGLPLALRAPDDPRARRERAIKTRGASKAVRPSPYPGAWRWPASKYERQLAAFHALRARDERVDAAVSDDFVERAERLLEQARGGDPTDAMERCSFQATLANRIDGLRGVLDRYQRKGRGHRHDERDDSSATSASHKAVVTV